MTFSVRAAQTGAWLRGYRYRARHRDEVCDWDLRIVEAQIRSVSSGATTGAASQSASGDSSSLSAQLEMSKLLLQGVRLLATRGCGALSIRVRHRHWLRRDPGALERFELNGRSDESADRTVLKIIRFLSCNGMNKWGQLRELILVLRDFANHDLAGEDYHLQLVFDD